MQVDGGRMDGFARQAPATMLYWDEPQLPFYYSLAKTFCVGDRWFASAPCQTYPNRRFMLAGTAFGLISTDTSSVTQDPPERHDLRPPRRRTASAGATTSPTCRRPA